MKFFLFQYFVCLIVWGVGSFGVGCFCELFLPENMSFLEQMWLLFREGKKNKINVPHTANLNGIRCAWCSNLTSIFVQTLWDSISSHACLLLITSITFKVSIPRNQPERLWRCENLQYLHSKLHGKVPFPATHVCSQSHRSRPKFSRSVPSLPPKRTPDRNRSWRCENLQHLRAPCVKTHFPCMSDCDDISTTFQILRGNYFQKSLIPDWGDSFFFWKKEKELVQEAFCFSIITDDSWGTCFVPSDWNAWWIEITSMSAAD